MHEPEAAGIDTALAGARPTRPWWKRPIIVVPVAIAVVAGGITGWTHFHSAKSKSTAPAGTTEQIVDVAYGTLDQTVAAQGTIAYANSANLSFAGDDDDGRHGEPASPHVESARGDLEK